MTGSMLFAGMLVIGLLDITVSGENTVKAAEVTNVMQPTYTTPGAGRSGPTCGCKRRKQAGTSTGAGLDGNNLLR